MKMTGIKVRKKPRNKAKSPLLNLIQIIALMPQKSKNNNIKKVSNSTTKWKPLNNSKRKSRKMKNDKKGKKTKNRHSSN